MVTQFESALDQAYSGHDGEAYFKYISDVANQTESREMMLSIPYREMSQVYKQSSLFADFKVKASTLAPNDFLVEIPPVEGEEPKIYDPLVMNPESKFVKCLIANSDKGLIKQTLDTFNSGLDISPTLAAGVMQNSLKLKDYDLPLVRLIIATHIYYEIGLIMLEVRPLTQ